MERLIYGSSSNVRIYKNRVLKTSQYPMDREYYINKLLNMIDPIHFQKPLAYTRFESNHRLEIERVYGLECNCLNQDQSQSKGGKECKCGANIEQSKKKVLAILANFPVQFTHYDLHPGNWIITETDVVLIDFGQSYLNIAQAEDYLKIERSKINWDKQVETDEWKMGFGRIPTIYDPCYDFLTLLLLSNRESHETMKSLSMVYETIYCFDDISSLGLALPNTGEDNDVLDLTLVDKNPKLAVYSGPNKIFKPIKDSDHLFLDQICISQINLSELDRDIYYQISCSNEIPLKQYKDQFARTVQSVYVYQKLEILKNPNRIKFVRTKLEQLGINYLARYN